jgi:hypothetical protein
MQLVASEISAFDDGMVNIHYTKSMPFGSLHSDNNR